MLIATGTADLRRRDAVHEGRRPGAQMHVHPEMLLARTETRRAPQVFHK